MSVTETESEESKIDALEEQIKKRFAADLRRIKAAELKRIRRMKRNQNLETK